MTEQRIGCANCDIVGTLKGARKATESEIHEIKCPECGRIGYMHEFPYCGTWPSEYSGCPSDPETRYSMKDEDDYVD